MASVIEVLSNRSTRRHARLRYLQICFFIAISSHGATIGAAESWQAGFARPGFDGSVLCTTTYRGELVVGGEFTEVNGVAVRNIARWNGQRWSPLGEGTDGTVRALEVAGEDLVAAGDVRPVGPLGSGIVRWDGRAWHRMVDVPCSVTALVVYARHLVVAGHNDVTDAPGDAYVARWDEDHWTYLGSLQGRVLGLTVYRSRLVATGFFGPRRHFYKYHAQPHAELDMQVGTWNGTTWTPLHPAAKAEFYAPIVLGEDLIVATRRWDADGDLQRWDGATWSSIALPVPAATVGAMASHDGLLYVAGQQDDALLGRASFVAMWSASSWQMIASQIEGSVHALGEKDRLLIAAGLFVQIGGVAADGLAAWNGRTWSGLGEAGLGLAGQVLALAQDPFGVVVAGCGLRHASNEAHGLLRIERTGWVPVDAPPWGNCMRVLVVHAGELVVGQSASPGLARSIGRGLLPWFPDLPARARRARPPRVFKVPDRRERLPVDWRCEAQPIGVAAACTYRGELVVGGDFDAPADVAMRSIAAWDGTRWKALGAGIDGVVWALVANGNRLYAGGEFEAAGVAAAHNVACWDGQVWRALDHGLDGAVLALTMYRDNVLAGGAFTRSGEVAAKHVARWDGGLWRPLAGGIQGGADTRVTALAVYRDEVVAGGSFTVAGDVPAHSIAAWNGETWKSLGTGIRGVVTACLVTERGLLVGGRFTAAGDRPARNVAFWASGPWSILPDTLLGEIKQGPVLVWTNPDEGRSLTGMRLQRGGDPSGPFDELMTQPLAPGPRLVYQDTQAEPGHTYWYRVQLLQRDGNSRIVGPVCVRCDTSRSDRTSLISTVQLEAGGALAIGYRLGGAEARVRLRVCDASGQRVRDLDSGRRRRGCYFIVWDGTDERGGAAGPGSYFIDLQAGAASEARQIVLR